MNCPFAIHPFVSNMINKEAKLGISEGTWLQYQLTFIWMSPKIKSAKPVVGRMWNVGSQPSE